MVKRCKLSKNENETSRTAKSAHKFSSRLVTFNERYCALVKSSRFAQLNQ